MMLAASAGENDRVYKQIAKKTNAVGMQWESLGMFFFILLF